MDIVDVTTECTISWPRKTRHRHRRPDAVNMQVVHRSHLEPTAEETAARFADRALGTGGKMPYHFMVEDDGTVKQCVPLSRIAPGALGVNKVSVHIAVHGDLRKHAPTSEQLAALQQLCKDLACYIGNTNVQGHTEIAGGSRDPLKQCPGRHMDMVELRRVVGQDFERWSLDDRDKKLRAKGYVI